MNKNNCLKALLAMLMCVFVVSCGSDDNDDSNSGNGTGREGTPANPSETFNGERLNNVDNGRIIFSYRDNGYVKNIKVPSSYDEVFTKYYNFSEDMKTVRLEVKNGYPGTFGFTYNAQGYIRTLSWGGDDRNSDNRSKTWEFSYDKDGHILSIKQKGSAGNALFSFTWQNGCLMKGGEGVDATSGYSRVFEFSYLSKIKNVAYQYSVELARMLYEDLLVYMAYLGYMGKGPDYLPDDYRVMVSQEDGDKSGAKSWKPVTGRIKYTFTETGLLKTEKTSNDYTNSFTYE